MSEKFLGYIYIIKCSISDKVYIGITNDITKRWNKHVYDTKHDSRCVIHRAMRKHGIENFSIIEIGRCASKKDLCEQEKFFIQKLNAHVSLGGYNVSVGGDKPMWGIKLSAKTRKLISNSLKGRPSPNKGKKATDAVKQKLSEAHSKSVVQIDLNGNIIAIHKSITEASKIIGVAGTNISKVCRNKKKTAGGFYWKYNKDK